MNNFCFGSDTAPNKFGYYETICGGSGAGPTWHGTSGVHTNMTNTRITDPEIMERRYPVILRQFSLRGGTGGDGLFRGGDGVVRDVEFTVPLKVSILSERRARAPYGMAGGGEGATGENLWYRKDGSVVNIGGKNTVVVDAGDRVVIGTPGGGGWGRKLLEGADEAQNEQATAAAAPPRSKAEPLSAIGNGSVGNTMSLGEEA
jgi:5-oxoprolinase (ATP-hydrolysing)